MNVNEELNKQLPKPDEYKYATYIPGRSTSAPMKVHRLKSHAKNAIGYGGRSRYERDGEGGYKRIVIPWWERDCKVFHLVDGEWIDVSEEFKP